MIRFCRSVLVYFACKLVILARGKLDDTSAKKNSKIIAEILSHDNTRCDCCVGCGCSSSCQEGIYKWLMR